MKGVTTDTNNIKSCVVEDIDGEDQADSYEDSSVTEHDAVSDAMPVDNKYNIPLSLTNFVFSDSL